MSSSKNINISEEEQKVIREAFTKMEGNQQPEALSSKSFKQWLFKMGPIGSFINEKYLKSDDETQCQLRTVGSICIQLPTDNILDASFNGARIASITWSNQSIRERFDKLLFLAKTIEDRRDLFVAAAVANGKTSNVIASTDIEFLIQCIYHFANLTLVNEAAVKLKPIGVVVVISEDDSIKMLWHVCGALAFGNAVVFQVNPENCILPTLLADVMKESGMPAGVFNVLFTTDLNRMNLYLEERGATNYKHEMRVFLEGPLEICVENLDTCSYIVRNWEYIPSSRSIVIIMEESDVDSAVFALLDNLETHKSSSVACVFVQESIVVKFHRTLQHHCKNSEFSTNVASLVSNKSEDQAPFSTSTCSSESLAEIELTSEDCKRKLHLTVFRSAGEVVDMCNSGKYKNASIWSEKLSLALDLAKRVKTSDVWINCMSLRHTATLDGSRKTHSLFRFKKRGTIEAEYMEPSFDPVESYEPSGEFIRKFYYGGIFNDCLGDKYISIQNSEKKHVLCISNACLKDVDNAISCAVAAKSKWKAVTSLDRAKLLYKISERFEKRSALISESLHSVSGRDPDACKKEVVSAIKKIRYWAAYSQLIKGNTQSINSNKIALHISEPSGVIGIICTDDSPLLSFISLVVSAVALGNVVVAFASKSNPKPAFLACEVFQDCSLIPGVVNVVYSTRNDALKHLFLHSQVNSVWVPRIITFIYDQNILDSLPFDSIKSKHFYSYQYDDTDDEWYSTDCDIAEELVFHATTNKVVWLPDNDIFP